MKTIYAQQGDTADAIAFRELGFTQGATEAIYTANPGLADKGPILPMGTRITIPEVTRPTQAPGVRLWD